MSLVRRLEGISDKQVYTASGRLRVSSMYTVADLKTIDADDTVQWQSVGTGSDTLTNNISEMAVTSGQYRIRATKRNMPYFSGKPTVIEMTAHKFHYEANVTKRQGYFSGSASAPYSGSEDGFFLKNPGDGSGIVFQVYNAGTLTKEVHIDDWLVDFSAHDWSKFTAIAIDFLWLGGAGVRLMVMHSITGKWEEVVHYVHAGIGTMTKYPTQRVRYDIYSTTGSGSLGAICAAVNICGLTDECGSQFSVRNPAGTPVVMAAVGTSYPMLAIRKQASKKHQSVRLTDIAGMVQSKSDLLEITIQLNPTLSGALSYSAVTARPVEIAHGNGSITVTTPGEILATCYLSQGGILPGNILDDDFSAWLGTLLDETPIPVVIVGTPLTTGVTANVSADCKQI